MGRRQCALRGAQDKRGLRHSARIFRGVGPQPCQGRGARYGPPMITTTEAIYEQGSLRLPARLPIPERSHVSVTISTLPSGPQDAERAAWLDASAEKLAAAWSDEDDVFNALLAK
jgi:hypothetical protein